MPTEFELKALVHLASIDASLKRLVQVANARAQANKSPEVADDADLDSRYGNEKVKLDPRDWHGPSFKGSTMNECPPEFLDELARAHDFFAKKNDDKGEVDGQGRPKSFYERRAAGRARGWAKRLRAGWKPPPPPPPMTDDAAEDAFAESKMGSGNFPAAGGFDESDPFGTGEADPFAEPNF